jgi:hypothetical protein
MLTILDASTLIEPGHTSAATRCVSNGEVPLPMKQVGRGIAIAAMVAIAILVIAFASKPAEKDYISYWSAAQQLAHHGDPYSYAQVFAIEKAQGYKPAAPIIMRNPPWALFLVLPLEPLSTRIGLLFWTAASIGCILACIGLLKVPPEERALAFFFAPVLACLASGQSSPFLLLGFSIFLRFQKSRPGIAGAALLLMAIKPHLFLVFWIVLLVDCIRRRIFRLLAGGAIALAAATTFATLQYPRIWAEYFDMLHRARLGGEFLQTPSFIFRYLVAPNSEWVQLVPSLAAILWAGWFYASNRRAWDWRIQGMIVMLATLLVSPYGWMTDEIVLLPAIMLALSNPEKPRYSMALFALFSGAAMALSAAGVQLSSGAFLWTTPAWLGWYLYSRPRAGATSESSIALQPADL